ncbi:hypothetical protein G3I55_10350, partial [Streptomyces sp. SID6648]|nr:hypothetical protein [Streptomyces sp. SID6648]
VPDEESSARPPPSPLPSPLPESTAPGPVPPPASGPPAPFPSSASAAPGAVADSCPSGFGFFDGEEDALVDADGFAEPGAADPVGVAGAETVTEAEGP